MRRNNGCTMNEFGDPLESTCWTMVLAAGGRGTQQHQALSELCQVYWAPVFGYLRSRCRSDDEASDLTQQFFLELLQRDTIAAADPSRGRFRAFLLTTAKHFLSNQRRRASAEKRGGNRPTVHEGETFTFSQVPDLETESPERQYERQWAVTLLQRVMDRLRAEQAAEGKEREFEVLKRLLAGRSAEFPQSEAAQNLGMTPEALRTALVRLRSRYRTHLRSEVAQTVCSEEEIDDEIRYLFKACREI